MLSILRHDARVANSEELDLTSGVVGLNQLVHGLVHGSGGHVVAVLEEGGHGVVDDFHGHVGCFVVGIDAAVDEGHAFVDRTRQA